MPYKPPEFDPDEPYTVIWNHLLDNRYNKKVYSRKKYVAQRRKQMSAEDRRRLMESKIDGAQIAAVVHEAQYQQGLRKPPFK